MRWNETVPWQEKYYPFLHMKSVWSWVFCEDELQQAITLYCCRLSLKELLGVVRAFCIRWHYFSSEVIFFCHTTTSTGSREQPGKELAFLLVESPAVCFWEVAAPADHLMRNVWWMSLGGYPQIQRTHIFLAEASPCKRLSVLFSRSLYCWANTQAQLI